MLQILRNKSQSIVIQIVVVIIALVFIFWGVGTSLFNKGQAALVINGEEVSFQKFQQSYDRAYDNIRNQFGGNIPQGLLENLGIKDQVVSQLIQETLIRQGAAEMGVRVSKEEIADTIQSMSQFQKEGSFNIERYNTLLNANNLAPTKFEESIKQDILTQKTSRLISQFAATATPQEIEELFQLEKSTVSFDYAGTNPDTFKDEIVIDDEELGKWYTTAQDNYKTSPEVKLQYLDFSLAAIGSKINIDTGTAKQYYEQNRERYTTPEQRHARHILFRVDENSNAEVREEQKKKATEILALAKNGDDFGELAKQYSEGPSKDQGGDLGTFTRGQMVKPFDDAVFSLSAGGISDIVETEYGYHIIKVEEITPENVTPYAEIQDEVITLLQKEQAKPLAFQMANEAYEGIIAAGSLAAYLQETPDAPITGNRVLLRTVSTANICR